MNAPANTPVSIPTLADAAMLIYVKISVWSARKLDKKQSAKTIAEAGASSDAARVNKHLLANADNLLKEVQRKANQIRDYVEQNSLPWDNAGNRLLSNAQSLVVVGAVHQLEQEFKAAVDEFVREYPVLRAQALTNLGDMADNDDYPQPDVVRRKFSVDVSFNPIATGFGDIRMGMSEAQAKAWQSHFEGNVQKQMNSAIHNAYERLREDLLKYSDRLKTRDDGSGKMEIFRDTMVSNLRSTVGLLSTLNVFGDAKLAELNRHVMQEIACYEPEALRNSPATSIAVKAQVDDVLARMKSILGE